MGKFFNKNLENMEITEEIIMSLVNDFEKREKEKETIYNNYDYINWLDNFTSKHNNFYQDSFLYNEDISQDDKKNVEKLDYLFECIDNYASNNDILPVYYDDINFGNVNYRFKYNNKYYEIGVMIGQGSSISLKTIDYNNEYNFIDFKDIVNSKTYTKNKRN